MLTCRHALLFRTPYSGLSSQHPLRPGGTVDFRARLTYFPIECWPAFAYRCSGPQACAL